MPRLSGLQAESRRGFGVLLGLPGAGFDLPEASKSVTGDKDLWDMWKQETETESLAFCFLVKGD